MLKAADKPAVSRRAYQDDDPPITGEQWRRLRRKNIVPYTPRVKMQTTIVVDGHTAPFTVYESWREMRRRLDERNTRKRLQKKAS